MRTSYAESLSPQGPVVALDKMVDRLRFAVAATLSTPPRTGLEWVVAELEVSFDDVERALAIVAAPLNHAARHVLGEMRALLWAMLPMELYPASSALLGRKEGM